MTPIEQDNSIQLNRFKRDPPSPSYISGLIDGDGCIFIRKITDGYQSGMQLTQCRTNVLQIIRYHFGGSITSSENRNNKIENIMNDNNEFIHKYNIRNQYSLVIRSNEYELLLNYIKDFIIIKNMQINCLYNFNKIVNLPNKIEEKEELYNKCSENNVKTTIANERLTKINIEYISGLFDAEGCFYINQKSLKLFKSFKIVISQKNHPLILHEIVNFLKFGRVTEYEYIISNKKDCFKFIELVKNNLIVKYNQAEAFETFLTTDDNELKEQMYKICNLEKHNIEHFTNLNQNDNGKERYFETTMLQELKAKMCKEINLIKVYKDKSDNMMGSGNHNYGKQFSIETKQKMSTSIRDSKNGVSDEIILEVKKLISDGFKNIEIQEILQLSRHTVSRIKNNNLVCRTDIKIEKTKLTQEELNINKRKIMLTEILIVIDDILEDIKPSIILNNLNEMRENNNIFEKITIDIIKNIKRNINQNKIPIYNFEIKPAKFNQYVNLIDIRYKELNK
jgi:hypothetical protein